MNSHRFLKIVFAILLLVTTGEVVYYAYHQFAVKKNLEGNGGNKITAMNTITSPTVAISENRNDNNKTSGIKIGDNTLNTYGSLIKSFLNKFDQEKALTVTLDVEFEGMVDIIQRDSNGLTTAFSVIDEEKKQVIKYEIDNSMKFWRSGIGNKAVLIEAKELETGQRVHIKDRIDLLNGSKFTGISIL
ncbi:hypothetical protein COV53_06015 [Candidatus Gottesmanbacteria bacterium CG11_big_fil_rev_8_21_14_0_20_37_11]|uniref:Uncharacterized protein n=3 Tax=Candidatus Gottesmaniibacteriota TaxID=1752720 RepID=A0A2M7RSM7_9BACT|nr:MAG: hypothetical protein AUJ73_02300 [Candidatus Gottesmanbacteria bacterium CG1_02_37_22]PIP32394.1 MAG: hypothetical protein COX23_04955 [Candidatus Gottesmanbacteria bacterium CG23_combo_of_CG06-09_8_20_14_all_37_19]PIR07856.1 MAG: hypothetical protein COV53_06015 [Candidatus Gottesmanbacteria bacterium CG11_big_fil_rev_8_21_14_0_20_37_11]PIZ03039.1 MAG: hypothetical protein COY59_01575 [Candidatus Gottesmanbacteria bacterium CG_4_10_14_0_8_um_filter_37_24]